ncbi:hypothetical protein V1503_22725 [Bacillus sp. SCS-151]|uniref:hypothetical protein n=1 Tax=Nanhaiella sioensis TaxID=3115293 RepID=UPI00397DB330
MQYQQMGTTQAQNIASYQQLFMQHAALAEHYTRQMMAFASNSSSYYRYAELVYFHKSRAIRYKGLFSATPFIQ